MQDDTKRLPSSGEEIARRCQARTIEPALAGQQPVHQAAALQEHPWPAGQGRHGWCGRLRNKAFWNLTFVAPSAAYAPVGLLKAGKRAGPGGPARTGESAPQDATLK